MPTTRKKNNDNTLSDNISAELLQRIYQWMVFTRVLDERCYKLQRQGRIGFYAGSAGEEACQIGTALAMDTKDMAFCSYRQPGVALSRGTTLQTVFNNLFGNIEDTCLGRVMPIHYSDRKNGFFTVSSVIGTQIIQAVGFGMASKIKRDSAVGVTYFGDGATSENDFHAGMNFAATFKAPTVFVLVNNQFAISTPVCKQTGVADLVDKAQAYGMIGYQIDGNDVLAVYRAMQEALRNAREGLGPTLLELKTYRCGPHSSSDDPARYRAAAEIEKWPDPITVFEGHLKQLKQGSFFNDAYRDAVYEKANNDITEAIKIAESIPQPAWESIIDDVYEIIPKTLQMQFDEIYKHEKDLKLTNEGEFPL